MKHIKQKEKAIKIYCMWTFKNPLFKEVVRPKAHTDTANEGKLEHFIFPILKASLIGLH